MRPGIDAELKLAHKPNAFRRGHRKLLAAVARVSLGKRAAFGDSSVHYGYWPKEWVRSIEAGDLKRNVSGVPQQAGSSP